MSSEMLRLNLGDLARGGFTAVVAALVITLYGVVIQEGFDLFATDWGQIGASALNAAFAAFIGYVGKNLMTDSSGKVLGRF